MMRMSAEHRREQLVDAAIRVMTREGVARATTRAIAAEAGIPLGALHYAFRSKQELMATVTETIARRSKADIDDAVLTDAHTDLYTLALAGVTAYFDHVVANPEQHLVTYELTAMALRQRDELGDVAKRQYDYYMAENERLVQAVGDLMHLEFLEPVPVISRYVFSVMDGLALNWLARGDEEEVRQVLRMVARTLVSMARPRAVAG